MTTFESVHINNSFVCVPQDIYSMVERLKRKFRVKIHLLSVEAFLKSRSIAFPYLSHVSSMCTCVNNVAIYVYGLLPLRWAEEKARCRGESIKLSKVFATLKCCWKGMFRFRLWYHYTCLFASARQDSFKNAKQMITWNVFFGLWGNICSPFIAMESFRFPLFSRDSKLKCRMCVEQTKVAEENGKYLKSLAFKIWHVSSRVGFGSR